MRDGEISEKESVVSIDYESVILAFTYLFYFE